MTSPQAPPSRPVTAGRDGAPAVTEPPRFRPFAVDDDRVGAAVVLRIAGSVDMASAPGLAQRVGQVLRSMPGMVIVDLTEVDFMATAGLSVLLEAQRVAQLREVAVRIVADNAVVGRPVELLGVDRTLHMYESLDAALAADGGTAVA